MKNEAHISTEQSPPKKNLRLSSPDENRQWPQSSETTTTRWTKDTSPLINQSFPKRLKLRKSFEFQQLKKKSQRLVGQTICIDWVVTANVETRLGMTASRRFGDAHERNRFKRLVREAFRTMRSELPQNLDLNILPRQRDKIASYDAIRAELLSLLNSDAVLCR